MVQVHQCQEVLDQRDILFLRLDEPNLCPHQLHISSFAEGRVAVEGGLQFFLLCQGEQCLRQTAEVPETDIGLLIEGIAAVVVRVVADKSRIVVVDETERAVVECDPQDRHVVGVHDAVRPADGLPLRNQPRCAFNDLGEKSRVLVRPIDEMRIVLRDHVIGQDFQLFMLLPIIEDLERAEAHMRRRHPHEHRACFDLLTIDLVAAADDAERPRRWNAQPMHGFAAEILADG